MAATPGETRQVGGSGGSLVSDLAGGVCGSGVKFVHQQRGTLLRCAPWQIQGGEVTFTEHLKTKSHASISSEKRSAHAAFTEIVLAQAEHAGRNS